MQASVKKWFGVLPSVCDLCKLPLADDFVDGKTLFGPWAIMCSDCHATEGMGLGTGRGQKYRIRDDGNAIKVEG